MELRAQGDTTRPKAGGEIQGRLGFVLAKLTLVLLIAISILPQHHRLYRCVVHAITDYGRPTTPLDWALGIFGAVFGLAALTGGVAAVVLWLRARPTSEGRGALSLIVPIAVTIALAYILIIPVLAHRDPTNFFGW